MATKRKQSKPRPASTLKTKPRAKPPRKSLKNSKSKPPTKRPSKGPAGGTYDAYRERQAAISRARSAKGREVGSIPDILDVKRRERCRNSLKLFCETYNPEPFTLEWSEDHLKVIARIEEAALLGALFGFAMPRGSGKTTLARMAALWVLSYAHRRYPFLIGATDTKAKEALDTLRMLIRFLPDYVMDFPEISWPAVCLAGIANRASGQTCGGESTLIEWSADRIVLPTVPPPANWPKTWKLRSDGKVPTSGVLVSASGLTGEGIRGSLKTLSTGEMVRPDFVLLDDPQTPESARSETQNMTRLRLVSADVLGMAGPGKSIAAVMPCTVIEQGDMVDEVLTRSKHPMWRGERTGILRSLPKDLAAWDPYFEIYARCAQKEPPDFTESNAYYVRHQAKLEEGAEASWPDRKEEWEVSAIQHAMHLYFRDQDAFWAEYMNKPRSQVVVAVAALDADALAKKTTNAPRRMIPRNCTRLTAMVDVDTSLLWYVVLALDERFGGTVVEYGSYPEQLRAYYSKADARPALTTLPGMAKQSQDIAIYAGLEAVTNLILGQSYRQEETGADLRVEKCLIDANWGPGTELVYEFCRRSPFAALLLPSHGKFIGASSAPMGAWQKRDGERAGWGWRISAVSTGRGRHVTYDTNQWKTFAAERLRTPFGAAGCISLHAPVPANHRLFGDHCVAEYPVQVTANGRTVDEWKWKPHRPDNHLWDCFVGACVAGHIEGVRWSASGQGPSSDKPKVKVIDMSAESRRSRQERSGNLRE